MKPHRVRQICGSRNPFTPSIVLWQHFILPCHHLRQPRQLSTATETATGSVPDSEVHAPSDTAPASAPNDVGETKSDQKGTPHPAIRKVDYDTNTVRKTTGIEKKVAVLPARKLRKVIDTRGQHAFDEIKRAAIQKNANKRADESATRSALLLAKAKTASEDSEDYEGEVVEAMAASRNIREYQLPWAVKYPPGEERTAAVRLAQEIAKFHDYARPNRSEALARRKVIEHVRNDVRDALPDHVLEVFGSERTGTALATSDIDLRLTSRQELVDGTGKLPPATKDRRALIDGLYLLRRTKFIRNNSYIMPMVRHARYPLISLQHRTSGLDVQIVLSNDTALSRKFMQQYMQEYPYLRQVYSVVKTTFDARGLSDVFRGGFGSYSIFMMLVASIKHAPNPVNDAANALMNFIAFWGHFDTTKQGVSIEPPVFFDKIKEPVMPGKVAAQLQSSDHKPLPPYMLCLRDPADETNDLGRKGVCIKHVQTTFRHLYRKLKLDLAHNNRGSFLQPFVGDTYMLNKARRERLESEGRVVLKTMQGSIAQTAQAIRDEEIASAHDRMAAEKLAQLSRTKSVASHSDAYGEAVTSVLGMPSVEEIQAEGVETSEPEHDIVYKEYPVGSQS